MPKEKSFFEAKMDMIQLNNKLTESLAILLDKLFEYKMFKVNEIHLEKINIDEIRQIYLTVQLLSTICESMAVFPWEDIFEMSELMIYLIDNYKKNETDIEKKEQLVKLRKDFEVWPKDELCFDEMPENIQNQIENFRRIFVDKSKFIKALHEIAKKQSL